MKKLTIAMVALTMAVVANAGAVRWKCADVVDPTDATEMFGGGTAYLFLSSVGYDNIEASILDGTFASTYASQAIYTTTFSDGAFDTGAILDGVYSGSTKLIMAAVDNASSIGYYMMGEEITQNIGTTGNKNFTWYYDDNASAWAAVGGSSVPEPSSGLLLLLGMAGLALRRRRA